MKKIPIFSLIGLFLISLVFPGPGVLASLVKSGYIPVSPLKQGNSQVLVKVVSQIPNPIIVKAPNVQSRATMGCLGSSVAAGNGNLVQQTGAINFNQPANCFALQLSRQTAPSIELAVKPLAEVLPKISIPAHEPVLSAPNFLPAPFAQTTLVLPLTFFGTFVGFVFFKRRTLKVRLLLAVSGLKYALTLHELQMLRC